jgi:hypothetical protein
MLSSQELFILFTSLTLTIANLLLNFDSPLTKHVDYTSNLIFVGTDLISEVMLLRTERLY